MATLYDTAGFEANPDIVWTTMGLKAAINTFILEILRAYHIDEIVNSYGSDEEVTELYIIVVLARGTCDVMGALLASTYINKMLIAVISLSLFLTIYLPITALMVVEIDKLSTYNLAWKEISLITYALYLFGDATYFVFMCEQFQLPGEHDQLNQFLLIRFWLANMATVFGSIMYRLIIYLGDELDFLYPYSLGAISGVFLVVFMLRNKSKYVTRRIPDGTLSRYVKYLWYLSEKRCIDYTREPDVVNDNEIITAIKYERRLCFMVFVLLPMVLMRQERDTGNWTHQYTTLNYHVYIFDVLPHEGRALAAIFNMILLPIVHLKLLPSLETKQSSLSLLKLIGIGYLFLGLAYVWSSGLHVMAEENHVSEPGYGQLRIYNTINYEMNVSSAFIGSIIIKPYEMKEFVRIHLEKQESQVSIYVTNETENIYHHALVHIRQRSASTCIILRERTVTLQTFDPFSPRAMYKPKIFFYCASDYCGNTIILRHKDLDYTAEVKIPTNEERASKQLLHIGSFMIIIDNKTILDNAQYLNGGIYSYVIFNDNGTISVKPYLIAPPFSINFVWSIPQYVLVSISDVFSVVAIPLFIYTQSPIYLRALNFGVLFFFRSLGDVVLVTLNRYRSQFSGMAAMEVIVIFVFSLLFLSASVKYRYVTIRDVS